MTIAAIWQEDGFQWCVADTRLVAGTNDKPTTEIAAKIYAIPVVASALGSPDHASSVVSWTLGFAPRCVRDLFNALPHRPPSDVELRQRYYRTQYGFVYAGAALPASMTAVTASTLLQNLACPGYQADPPTFEQIADVVHRLSRRFMTDRRRFTNGHHLGGDGIFSAAFFGWCPHSMKYKIAHIDGREDAGSFRVDLFYPPPPETDGEPWVVLGSGAPAFESTLAEYRLTEKYITKRLPRRVVDKMIAEEKDQAVGGATSIGAAHRNGFELFYAVEPIVSGEPAARRIFNGLDLDTEIGPIGQYTVAAIGIA
jgi:hypothetical protein